MTMVNKCWRKCSTVDYGEVERWKIVAVYATGFTLNAWRV